MTRLLLVRHGVVAAEYHGVRCYGDLDVELSDLGRAQSQRIPERLAAVALDAVYSSPLKRALLPAQLLSAARGIPHQILDDLREVHRGSWAELEWNQIHERWPGELERFIAEPDHVGDYGGESLTQVGGRTVSALERICAEHLDGAVAITCHNWIVRAALGHVLGLDLSLCERWVIRPASISEVEIGERRLVHRVNLEDPQPLS